MSEESRSNKPPQNIDAERSVLGGILLSNEQLDDLVGLLTADDFYAVAHRHIYSAMVGMYERRSPIDIITLAEQLRRDGTFADAGGAAYLATLDSAVPATASIARYGVIVQELAVLRRVIQAGLSIAREGQEQRGEVPEFLDRVQQRIFDVTERRGENGFCDIKVVVKGNFSKLEELYERQEEVTGLRTGLSGLDIITAGLQNGDLIIVAGRPSMGKTSLAMGIGQYLALDQKEAVAAFSMEMSADALTTRIFSSDARVDGQRLRTGKLLDSDWPKLARSADRLYHSPLFIDDSPGQTALQMRAKCRRLKMQRGLKLVIVDYMQLMHAPAADSREQEIASISRGLKELARELSVPVIALSQLNRSLEKRDDKRPMMSDLRESGALEQDADVIAFVYRDEVYNKESPDRGIAEIIIGKQRNGPTGTVRVGFLRDYTRFENLREDA